VNWLRGFLRALGDIAGFGLDLLLHPLRGMPGGERALFLILAGSGLAGTLVLGQVASRPSLRVSIPANHDAVSRSRPPAAPIGPMYDLRKPRRDIPKDFRLSQSMPARPESDASGTLGMLDFNASRDLVRVYDTRVWWESENDDHERDTEDDHLMHWCMEEPFRRLVELVVAQGGLLKVQDAYRAEGIHKAVSLHKQGRAIDLTCDNMSLARLSALTWAAGFDWVLYERGTGHHVHASVHPKGRRRLQ
jgi:hypothetical protein